MVDIITREDSISDLNELVHKLIPEIIGKEIEKAAEGIYPLQNVLIRKVKMLRSPKTDVQKLLELHGGADAAMTTSDLGKTIERTEDGEKEKNKFYLINKFLMGKKKKCLTNRIFESRGKTK